MHAIGDERGGNGVAVSFLGSPVCGSARNGIFTVAIGMMETREWAPLSPRPLPNGGAI